MKSIAACVKEETTDEETASREPIDEVTIDGPAVRKCVWEYLENDLTYNAELSMLEAEKDKIDAEVASMNSTASQV